MVKSFFYDMHLKQRKRGIIEKLFELLMQLVICKLLLIFSHFLCETDSKKKKKPMILCEI